MTRYLISRRPTAGQSEPGRASASGRSREVPLRRVSPCERMRRRVAAVSWTPLAALLIEVGPGASLEAIARRAGVGIATLYRHFPRRAALVTAVAVDVMARTYAEAAAAPAEESDAFAALRRVHASRRWMSVPRPSCRCSTTRYENSPEVRALLDATAATQSELYRRGPATGVASSRCRFRRHRVCPRQVFASDRARVRSAIRSGCRGAPPSGCVHRWSARAW